MLAHLKSHWLDLLLLLSVLTGLGWFLLQT